jgi:hypothetical protein
MGSCSKALSDTRKGVTILEAENVMLKTWIETFEMENRGHR